MKYRLLRPLPGFKEGYIIDDTDTTEFSFLKSPDKFPDFFEPIVEKKTIHEKSGTCFMINRYGNVDSSHFDDGIHFLCKSNRFLTREEAEDEHKRREYSVRPDKFIPEIGEDYFYPTQNGIVEKWTNSGTAGDFMIINAGLAFKRHTHCEKAIKKHDLIRLFYTIR